MSAPALLSAFARSPHKLFSWLIGCSRLDGGGGGGLWRGSVWCNDLVHEQQNRMGDGTYGECETAEQGDVSIGGGNPAEGIICAIK